MNCGRVGSGLVPELWYKPFVENGLAFSGCVGQCRSTHSFHAVERPREESAAWRASLLLDSEEAGTCARQRGLSTLSSGMAFESQS